jgi:hypothetical protein
MRSDVSGFKWKIILIISGFLRYVGRGLPKLPIWVNFGGP